MSEHKHTNRTIVTPRNLPFTSGIYQIRCKRNGKVYVGSTVNLSQRWTRHVYSLRRGNHKNIHLQQAWNKYGKDSFEFSILELVPAAQLLVSEQKWIDQTRCTNRQVGFNIYPIASSPGNKNARIWKGFVDPEGNEVTIVNLFEFCREHSLDFPSMHRLAKGKSKLKSYKGWTHRNSQRKREYVKTYNGFISPDGNPMAPITNLAAFCRQNGLDPTHMVAVSKGRIHSHRGWTHVEGRPNLNTLKFHKGFISPDGNPVIITNLQAFCKQQGLHPVHMHEVKSGKRKSHKGWTWRQTNE